ncbi:MAG TPA: hypothetical protein VFX16_37935 [Pseudonocardiaceae bacterium]|nr:hypothetical protein [Pseudonocardiaceae bacterium]
MKIGFQLAMTRLRDGAELLVTTRFEPARSLRTPDLVQTGLDAAGVRQVMAAILAGATCRS